MCDKEDARIKMTHDGYLKLWHLKSPNLQYFEPHDILLIDEGQDMNPPMLDIFLKQKTPKVVVGDPHQQIYTFRGAVNALDAVNNSSDVKTYYLTQSFRFGPEIGFVANCAIETLKDKDAQTLVGGKKTDSLIDCDTINDVNINQFKPIAVIGRTNRGIFDHVVKFVTENSMIENAQNKQENCSTFGITDCNCCRKRKRMSACFAGGSESYNFNDYLDLHFLSKGQNEKMKKYKTFSTLHSIKKFAMNTNDHELLSKIECVKKYGDKLPGLIDLFKKYCTAELRQADYVFSTAHKSKGLEWKTVVLLEDFVEIPGHLTNRHLEIEEDEKNLLYVALTRAKNNLVISKNILNLIITNGDFLERISFSRENIEQTLEVDRGNSICIACESIIVDLENNSNVCLYRKNVNVSPYRRAPGNLCSICSCQMVQSIPVWQNIDVNQTERLIFDLYRASLMFICGPKLQKEYKNAKDLFGTNRGNEIRWQAVAVRNGGVPNLNGFGQIIGENNDSESENDDV